MAQRLLVVERYKSALSATLVRQFEGDTSLVVVVDRRKARRRRRTQMREMDRRQTDRREGAVQGGKVLRSEGFFWASRDDGARATDRVAAITLSGTA